MKALPWFFMVGMVCHLLGGLFVKYCPYPDVWWVGNMAADFGSGTLGILSIANIGKIRAILAMLSGEHPSPAQNTEPVKPPES